MSWSTFECNVWFSRVTILGAGAALGVAATALLDPLIERVGARPPIETRIVEALIPEVPPGGTLPVRYEYERYRICPAEIRGFWLDSSGAPFGRLGPVTGGYTPIGPGEVTINLPVPENAREFIGEMVSYRSVVTSYCEDGQWTMHDPDVTVKIASNGN